MTSVNKRRMLPAPGRQKCRDENAFCVPLRGSAYNSAPSLDPSSAQRIKQPASEVSGSVWTISNSSLDHFCSSGQKYSTSSMRTHDTAPQCMKVDLTKCEPFRSIETHTSKDVAQRESFRSSGMAVSEVFKTNQSCSPSFEPQQRLCTTCGIGDSPEWRKGSDGRKTLCNACGLRHWRSVSRARRRLEKESLYDQIGKGKALPSCRPKFAKRRQHRGVMTSFACHPSSTNFEYLRMSMSSSAAEVQEQLQPIYIAGDTPASANDISRTMQTLCKERTEDNN